MGLGLKNDVIFKAVFGSDTEESKQALIGMLNLLLDRKEDPIRKIIYKNPFNIREFEAQKESVLDIKAETDKEELIDIEMQLVYDDEFIPRDVYYHCGMVRQGLAAGQSYGMLKKTISIYLMDHIWFGDEKRYHRCFQLRDKEDDDLLTDLVEMHYFELPKVNPGRKKSLEELTEVERFLEYLRLAGGADSEIDDYFTSLMRTGGKEMEMTQGVLQQVTEDELLREKAIARDKFLFMQASLERQRERTKKDLEETQKALTESQQALTESQQALAESEQALAESEQALAESEQALAESEQALAESEQALTESQQQLAEVSCQLSEKDQQLKELQKELEELRSKQRTLYISIDKETT